MPEAIATTKRKFYRALDNLNNPPATSKSDPASKRVRRSISSTSTARRIQGAFGQGAEQEFGKPKPIPNYSPWSHETFLARLKTFSSVRLWHPKPKGIGEVEWAKWGWSCVDVNTVACRGGCEKRVVVNLDFEARRSTDSTGDEEADEGAETEDNRDDDEAEALENALVRRFQTLIVEAHAETCLWRKGGCKDDIYHLPVVRPAVWQPELKSRFQSLVGIDSTIRDIQIKMADSLETSAETVLADLPDDLLGTDKGSGHQSIRPFEIALHGWRGSKDSGNELLLCDVCFQRIGLWMYQPGYRASRTSSDDEDLADSTVDLVEMHRDHCPWRNPATQRATGTLTGLNAIQILHRVVATYAREQRRKSAEQAKSIQQFAADDEAEAGEGADVPPLSPALSRAEVDQQDKERESRLRKLKSLFTIKRRPTSAVNPASKAR